MVGEWQRDQPASCNRAVNLTKDQTILQIGARSRSGIDDRFISIRFVKSLEPGKRMENRGARVPLQKVCPSLVLERVNFVKCHAFTAREKELDYRLDPGS